jgi:hypothetical protein
MKSTTPPASEPQKNEILGSSQETTVELVDSCGEYVKFTLSQDAIIDLVNELLSHPNIAEHIEP